MTHEDERALEQLVLRFWRALDRRDYAAMLAMLTDDASWLREEWLVGQEAIGQSLEARPSDLQVRHLVTNIIVDPTPDGAEVTSLVTAFAASGPEADILPSAAPALLADVDMAVVRAGFGWSIKRIEPRIRFRQSPAAAPAPAQQTNMKENA